MTPIVRVATGSMPMWPNGLPIPMDGLGRGGMDEK